MSEVDKDLSEQYRTAARDEPPAHADAAVLAAAKRAVASQPRPAGAAKSLRRWYMPVSLAAVITLSVIVTLRVAHERPEIAMPDAVPVARKNQVLPSQTPPAPVPAPAQPAAPAFAPDPKPAARPAAIPVPAPARMEKPREDSLPAADVTRSPAAAGQVADQKTAEIPAVPAAAATAAEAAGVRREARAMSAPAVSQATLAKRDLAPEAWLERIADLRKQGEDREADEQLAEFKRRYPDYRIPEAMNDRIAPRK